MAPSRSPSLANITPRTSGLKRHVCLRLFAVDVWLGSEGPDEIFVIMKMGYRSFTSTTARRDADGRYHWGSTASAAEPASPTDSAFETEESPLHEWILESSRFSRCQLMQAHIFAALDTKHPAVQAKQRELHTGSNVIDADGSMESERYADTSLDSKADAEQSWLSDDGGVNRNALGPGGKCLGYFDVSLFSVGEQTGMQSIQGSHLLPHGLDQRVTGQAPTTTAKPSNQRLQGSLSLLLWLENRDAFLEDSRVLTQRTDDYLEMLNHLTAKPDLSVWPLDKNHMNDLIYTDRKVETEKAATAKHLETLNTSLRAIVVDQQGRIDALKDSLKDLVSPSEHQSPSTHAVRTASPSVPAVLATGMGGSRPTPGQQSSPKHPYLQAEPAKTSNSEVQRFLREHAHQRRKLEPFIKQHLSNFDGPLSVGESRPGLGHRSELDRPLYARDIRSGHELPSGFRSEVHPELGRRDDTGLELQPGLPYGHGPQAGFPRQMQCDVDGRRIPPRSSFPLYNDYDIPLHQPKSGFRQQMHARFRQAAMVESGASTPRPQRIRPSSAEHNLPAAPSSPSGHSRSYRPDPVTVAAEDNIRRMLLRHFQSPSVAFKTLDLDNDGLLTLVEFRRAFKLARLDASEDMVRRLWRRAKGGEEQYVTMDRLSEFLLHGH